MNESGSPEPGRAVANVPSSGGSRAVVCAFARKGAGSTPRQQHGVFAKLGEWSVEESGVTRDDRLHMRGTNSQIRE